MYGYDNFYDNGLTNLTSFIPFVLGPDHEIDNRLANLDDNTRDQVQKHMSEFHSKEEMEIFINNLEKKKEKDSFS